MTNEIDDDDWSAFQQMMRDAADQLRRIKGVTSDEQRLLRDYFLCGYDLGQPLPALIDHLGISTPSVLGMAGYSDNEAQRIMDSLVDMEDFPNPPDAA